MRGGWVYAPDGPNPQGSRRALTLGVRSDGLPHLGTPDIRAGAGADRRRSEDMHSTKGLSPEGMLS